MTNSQATYEIERNSPVEPKALDGPINQYGKVKTSRIFLATTAANISAVAIGICMSWSSPIGPKLTSQDPSESPLSRPISVTENAWISSIFTIGAILTPFVSGPLSDKIGRKKVFLFSSIFFILGFLFLLTAREFWHLIAGRLTLGFGAGFSMCVIPVYVGEISTDRTRGATNTFMSFLITVGVFFCYCIGPYVSYSVLQYFCLLVPIIFVIVFIFMPESPFYLIAKDQRSAASKALQFLRGQDADKVEAELAYIENLVKNSLSEKANILDVFKTKGSRRALLISFGLVFFQQVSGLKVLVFYTQALFESAQINLDAAIAVIINGFVQLITAGVAPFVVNKVGRKTILLYSVAFMGISLTAIGYFFFSQIVLETTNGIKWLPLTALLIYDVVFGLGFGPVPWVLVSEIFAPNTRSIAAAMTTSFSWFIVFLVALFYPALDALGTYYAYWLFAITCIFAFFFVLFIVPETKDLSFSEIQNKLKTRSRS